MIDQLKIGNKSSYDDFEASLNQAKRQVDAPKKKSIKEKLPFSNITYDFSGINGEIYWEDRNVKYVFEITAMTPEELEVKKKAFKNWVMNTMNEDIHDPFIKNHHFKGTFDNISFDDSEIEKSTITVTFTAYPYMISNEKTVYEVNVTSSETTITVKNGGSHRITPTFINDVPVTIKKDGITYSISAGTTTDSSFMLPMGETELTVKTTASSGNLSIEFYEEVF